MTKEKEIVITNFTKIFETLPPKEQGFVLGRIEGYQIGYADAKKESEKKLN